MRNEPEAANGVARPRISRCRNTCPLSSTSTVSASRAMPSLRSSSSPHMSSLALCSLFPNDAASKAVQFFQQRQRRGRLLLGLQGYQETLPVRRDFVQITALGHHRTEQRPHFTSFESVPFHRHLCRQSAGGRAACPAWSRRDWPSSSSITKYGCPSVSPRSSTAQMFGWFNAEAARASRSKRGAASRTVIL